MHGIRRSERREAPAQETDRNGASTPWGGVRLAALVLCAAVAFGCSAEDPWEREDPTDALRYFLAAVKYRDNETVWEFLDEADRAVLEAQSARLEAMTGGGVTRSPADFLSSGHVVSSPVDYADIRVDEDASSGDTSIVIVELHDEREVRFEMTRADGRWTVDLPLESAVLNGAGSESAIKPEAGDNGESHE